MSTKQERFIERYKAGEASWDVGRPDQNLVDVISDLPISGGKVLELGCGYGDNAIWLAQQFFDVTGVDVSDIAVKKAEENAAEAGVECSFRVMDFLEKDAPGAPFGLVFDRGCFHSFDTEEERSLFARRVAEHLEADGLWLTLVGSADDPPRETGPPRRSLLDVVHAVEPSFEIISISAGHFESTRETPPRAWICLLKKRP